MHIPACIKRQIGFEKGALDQIGCSGAQVMIFDDKVLKIQPDSNAAGNEHQMLHWLQGKLPVPKIIEEAFVDGMRYLLMSRIRGSYLCEEAILDDQYRLAELVADGLRKLWAVDISACPTNRTLDAKFREIEAGIRSGAITLETARQDDTYGPGGFASPASLFDWLVRHRPTEEPVLSHGDYCLPNIFCDNNGLTGFIDLGYAGIADKWVDIEKVSWSMWANSTGPYSRIKRNFDRNLLFDALDIQPDEERIRYYSLLSELC